MKDRMAKIGGGKLFSVVKFKEEERQPGTR